MRKDSGFALAMVLTMIPVIALIAWTFLSVGSALRAKATLEENNVKALHAAEAGIRLYLVTGQKTEFQLNGCLVTVCRQDNSVSSIAIPERSVQSVTVSLQIDRGFVVGRRTDEKY